MIFDDIIEIFCKNIKVFIGIAIGICIGVLLMLPCSSENDELRECYQTYKEYGIELPKCKDLER